MRGLIHIYCGDGKGKTTCSLGLSMRFAGNGGKVLIVQFLKGQDTSELSILNQIENIDIVRGKITNKFTFAMNDDEKSQVKKTHDYNLQNAIESVQNKEYDLLILDEILGAYNTNLIDKQLLEDFIKNKPEHLELVLTGRNPADYMIDCADYVSEIQCKKHPYEQGIPARKGVEM